MTQHYKDNQNNIYGYKPKDIEVTPITMEEVLAINESKITPEQRKQARIAELKTLLSQSDYKTLPDYDKTDEDILVRRQAWRDEIRTLEVSAA